MTLLPRSVDDAIMAGRAEMVAPSQSWDGLCQRFVRKACYDVPAWAASAVRAWEAIPKLEKFPADDPFDAPRGACLYYTGGQFGHVALAIGRKTSDKCLSNDYTERGKIGVAPRDFPRWGIEYVGWSFWTPFGELGPGGSELWDGITPPIENVMYADEHGARNKAAWRLSARLFDLGYYNGYPQDCYLQGYPVKAVKAMQSDRGWKATGEYGPKFHQAVFA